MIAVIETGGKQYKVKEGQTIKVEKLDKAEGAKVVFDTLLVAKADGSEVSIGRPLVGQKVTGEISEQGTDKKTVVVKYKRKTRYLRTKGHRQLFTKVKIASIA